MGRIHPYGEPKHEDSPSAEFFYWLFIVGLGFPLSYGWIFVSLNWLSNAELYGLSGGLGAILGRKALIRIKEQKTRLNFNLPAIKPRSSGVVKEGTLYPPEQIDHPLEKISEARSSGEKDCGRCSEPNIAHDGFGRCNAFDEVFADASPHEWFGHYLRVGTRNGGGGDGENRHHHRHPISN